MLLAPRQILFVRGNLAKLKAGEIVGASFAQAGVSARLAWRNRAATGPFGSGTSKGAPYGQ